MRVDAGMQVRCSDGAGGAIADVIVDPVARRLTHLVVQPRDHTHGPRLVPVTALSSGPAAELLLTWTEGQLLAAPLLQETDFLELPSWPHQHDGWDVGIARVLAWPIYTGDNGPDSPRWSAPGDRFGTEAAASTLTTYDKIPPGTAELRRASEVLSSDGHVIGHVDGFVVGPDQSITHLVLEHGHLWGRRDVTIPIADVTSLHTDVVHLRVPRDAVGAYPAVHFHRHHSA